MTHDDKRIDKRIDEPRLQTQERDPENDVVQDSHVVFDFTGLERPDVGDLALILTARFAAGPEEHVWLRALPSQTARVLQEMRLDHLFLEYPTEPEHLN
ncbi:MAG: STAS domain-containing protein [Gemmatimonadota bacterium]|nr:STAS domain-containing protein [Gemmatimonadota bacterium]